MANGAPTQDELIHFLMMTSLYHQRLGVVTRQLLHGIHARIDQPLSQKLDELNAQGCSRVVLLNLVALVGAFRKLPSDFKVTKLRRLARDTKSLLQEMKNLAPPVLLPWEGNQEAEDLPTSGMRGGVLDVTEELEADLTAKLEAYNTLASLCHTRQLPNQAMVRGIAYIWPIVYVNDKTGKPHYEVISELFELLQELGVKKMKKNADQLDNAFTSAKKNYPQIISWMKAQGKRIIPFRPITAKMTAGK